MAFSTALREHARPVQVGTVESVVRRARDRARIWPPLLRGGIRPLLVAADLASLALAAVVTQIPPAVALVFTAVLLSLYTMGGLYRSRLHLAVLDDLPNLLGRLLIATGLVMIGSMAVGDGAAPQLDVAFAAVVAALIPTARAVAYGAVRWLRAVRLVNHPTLIVGAGRVGRDLADVLEEHPQYGLRPWGFLDPDHQASTLTTRPDTPNVPVYGDLDDLPELLSKRRLRTLVIAYGRLPSSVLVDTIRACHRHRCEVFVIPRLYELQHVADDMDMVWSTPLIRLRRAAHRSVSWRLKRLIDIVFASFALILAAPVMAVCAIAVRIEVGRNVIFRQERVGIDGRAFEVLKLCSMKPATSIESQTTWNIANDDRVGPVGKFLRATSLDELPQLINVLRGEMSLVGPRPERPAFVQEFADLYPGYGSRHRVPCGLTGLAQVHGLRGDTSIEERARFDNLYIENWSLWLDLKIMLRTVIALVKSPGA